MALKSKWIAMILVAAFLVNSEDSNGQVFRIDEPGSRDVRGSPVGPIYWSPYPPGRAYQLPDGSTQWISNEEINRRIQDSNERARLASQERYAAVNAEKALQEQGKKDLAEALRDPVIQR